MQRPNHSMNKLFHNSFHLFRLFRRLKPELLLVILCLQLPQRRHFAVRPTPRLPPRPFLGRSGDIDWVFDLCNRVDECFCFFRLFSWVDDSFQSAQFISIEVCHHSFESVKVDSSIPRYISPERIETSLVSPNDCIDCLRANRKTWNSWQEIISCCETEKHEIINCVFQIPFQPCQFNRMKIAFEILP
jgi:hypothetical protein